MTADGDLDAADWVRSADRYLEMVAEAGAFAAPYSAQYWARIARQQLAKALQAMDAAST